MSKSLSFVEAVTAYAHGASVQCVHSNGQVFAICNWDEPLERFADPQIRRDAARAFSRKLRVLLTYEDPEMSFYISQ